MEALFIYLIKSSGLIVLFYLAYFLMLRKETFFTSNRWFLLAGLITSVLLPFVFITKIIWVEPTATPINWSTIPVTNYTQEKTFEDYLPMLTALAYGIGILLLLGKFAFDFYSLNAVLKGKSIQQQADFKFIDIKENVAPFSYFNTIVYNSALYTASELENILEHEKVHSEQNHTIDVLISRLFCIVFWFNPFIWWYKKAMLQNLEFIADNEATKKISDKKSYQITLLKITTHENCVAITNHFYQSLIKKRIVMLNKNQSKKWNSWKYALVLPVLVAFVFLFQIKTIAQEKVSKQKDTTNATFMTWDKNTSDEEISKDINTLKEQNITIKYSNLKRNSNNEIIGIKVEFKDTKGHFGITEFNGDKAIQPIRFFKTDDEIGFGEPKKTFSTSEHENVANLSREDVENIKNNDSVQISFNEVKIKKSNTSPNGSVGSIATNTYIYINGKKVSKATMEKLDPSMIQRMDVDKKNKKSIIKIITKTSTETLSDLEIPTPPTPPKFPDGPMPVAPAPDMSKLPAPPAHPSNVKDKKAMAEFEEKMKEFEKKMESFEPDMTVYEKEVEEVMAKREKIFEKEMAKYEEAMEKYRDAMEKRNN
ncbi:M56 family metallopeptidase [Flavobacterium sp. ZT3R25]|uniref:M56 family metallopeptidase n=1 Tax=Flavobacterium galactosi TaxID=3398735 RepID=UPI003A87375E